MKYWIPIACAAFFFSCQNPAGITTSSTENPSKAAPDTGIVPVVSVVSVGCGITYSGNGSLFGVAPTDGKIYPQGDRQDDLRSKIRASGRKFVFDGFDYRFIL